MISLAAVLAGRSFIRGYKTGEAVGGAEERRGASPLKRCLSSHQDFSAVGTEHVSRQGLEERQRLCFDSWGRRENRRDPQILLSKSRMMISEATHQILDLSSLINLVKLLTRHSQRLQLMFL